MQTCLNSGCALLDVSVLTLPQRWLYAQDYWEGIWQNKHAVIQLAMDEQHIELVMLGQR